MKAIYGVYMMVAIGALAAFGYPMWKNYQSAGQTASACLRISDPAEKNACHQRFDQQMKLLQKQAEVVTK